MHVVATISDRAQLKDSRKASGKIRMCKNFVLLLLSFYSSILHWDAFLLPFSGPHALLFTFSLKENKKAQGMEITVIQTARDL